MMLLRFIALLFAALALRPALAHLLELPNKIGLSREDYFAVQQIYRGWALLGPRWSPSFASPARRRYSGPSPIPLLPEGWQTLRAQWEYSHAASAVLNLAAFVALLAAVLPTGDTSRK